MPYAALLNDYVKRLNSHQWEEVEPLIDENAIFIFNDGTYHGKAAIEEACRRTFALISNDNYEITDKKWSYVGPGGTGMLRLHFQMGRHDQRCSGKRRRTRHIRCPPN